MSVGINKNLYINYYWQYKNKGVWGEALVVLIVLNTLVQVDSENVDEFNVGIIMENNDWKKLLHTNDSLKK